MEKTGSEDNRKPSEKASVHAKGSIYDDLENVEVVVPCSSWDHEEAVKCWGDDYGKLTCRGIIRKVSMRRNGKEPRFEIEFPDKKGQNSFVGFDLNYVMSYADEVPLRYHKLKAEHIMKGAKKAELAMLKEASSPKNAKKAGLNLETKYDTPVGMRKAVSESDMDLKMPAADEAAKQAGQKTASNTESKKRSNASTNRDGKKKKTSKPEEYSFHDDSSSAEETDNDPDNDEETQDLLSEDAALVDAEGKDISHFNADLWRPNVLPDQNEIPFLGKSGPQHTLSPSTATPFEYFCLFIPIFYWDRWAKFTNEKADAFKNGVGTGQGRHWESTSGAEIKAWVASVIWWCLGVTQSMECYWADSYERSKMKQWFSYKRWVQLKRFFKVSSPVEDDANKGDKLQKVREIWDDFIGRCKMLFALAQQIGIDEAIKKFKGRCSFKQYIKSKPVRWGLKIFCVCCSLTGYLWNATIYVGKDDTEEDKKKEISTTHFLVKNLLTPLSGKNHIAHMDNWFTSIPLFNDLAVLLIWCCGTIRVNRKGLCKYVTMLKKEETTLKKNPGTIRWASYGYLCYISWFAKRAVHMLTNCYMPQAVSENQPSTVMHWFSEKGEKVQREIPRPPAVSEYNLYMGAVDMFDQYRSYVKIELRSRKFWHPLFWFIIEAALINSWLLYKATRELAMLPLEYTLFTFRKSVALALVAEWENMGCKNRTCLLTPTKKMQENKAPSRSHLKKCNLEERTRFNSPDGHLSAFQKIPLREDSKLKVRQMLCQQCRTRRTTYWCKQCEQPLCQGFCFQQFHNRVVSPEAIKEK
jgi:hypothetical protein